MPISYRNGPQTTRLLHRAFEVGDAEVFYKLSSDPDIMRYTGDKYLASVGEAKRAIIDYPDFDRFGYGRWASVHKDTQQVIGFCGLKYLPDLDEVDIGYRFLPSHWGVGLATEASSACLEFGFRVLGLTRIVAFVIPENAASLRVLEKSGMKFESEVDYDGILALRYAKEHSG
jgi:RimJ/RimL family protein N-acetyltransferase